MNIITRDIIFYNTSLEFYQHLLTRCHPDEEQNLKTICDSHKKTIAALEGLEKIITPGITI